MGRFLIFAACWFVSTLAIAQNSFQGINGASTEKDIRRVFPKATKQVICTDRVKATLNAAGQGCTYFLYRPYTVAAIPLTVTIQMRADEKKVYSVSLSSIQMQIDPALDEEDIKGPSALGDEFAKLSELLRKQYGPPTEAEVGEEDASQFHRVQRWQSRNTILELQGYSNLLRKYSKLIVEYRFIDPDEAAKL